MMAASSDLDLASAADLGLVSTHHLTRKREVQKHAAELVERDLVTLSLDRYQMGVGGVHSWGAKPFRRHALDPTRPHSFEFVLAPFAPPRGSAVGGEHVDELARAAAAEAQLPAVAQCVLPAL